MPPGRNPANGRRTGGRVYRDRGRTGIVIAFDAAATQRRRWWWCENARGMPLKRWSARLAGRVAPLVWCAAALCLPTGGCSLAALFTRLEPAPPIDFAYLARLTDMTIDVTELNFGWQLREDVRSRYSDAHTTVEFITAGAANITLMLLTDEQAARQTVILPGTSRLPHLVFDMARRPVYDEELGANLHAGFRSAALLVREALAPRLRADYELHLAGYSLGGAVAVILGAHLAGEGWAVAEIVTLGQPPVTDADGAARLAELPLLRLIAGDDTVVWWTERHYVHFGPALILLDGPYIVYLPPDDPDYDLAAALLANVDDQQRRDHASYRQRMASKVGVDVWVVDFADRREFLLPEGWE